MFGSFLPPASPAPAQTRSLLFLNYTNFSSFFLLKKVFFKLPQWHRHLRDIINFMLVLIY
jgi:hypothetical protein